LLAGLGVYKVFLVIAAGQSLASLVFALAALRTHREHPAEVAVST